MKKHKMHLGLGAKIIMLACVMSFASFLLISVVLYQVQYNSLVTSLDMERGNLCGQATAIAENACSYLRGVADYCSASADLEYILFNKHDDPAATKMARNLFSMFQPSNYVLNIILYNLDGVPVQYMSIDASHSPQPQGDNPIFQRLISRKAAYEWEYVANDETYLFMHDNSPKECLWRVVKSSNNTTVYGVVVVSIDVRNLLRYEVSYTSSYSRGFQIFDRASGSLVSNSSSLSFNSEQCKRLSEQIGTQSEGDFELTLAGEEKRIYFRQIADTSLVTLYVSDGIMFTNDHALLMLMLLLLGTFVLVLVPLLGYITRNLTRPLERLTFEMKKFSAGDFTAHFNARTDDTVGQLAQSFNSMVAQHKELIEQTYVAQLKAREAELILLQAQINPHFIYNLINSIQWSALRKGEKDIANIAYSMGQIFRISLNRGSNIIPISKECELINYYLTLQKSRYGPKLTYDIRYTDDSREVLIPKLIIQPLVENAIVHGTEKLVTPIHIDTHISVEKDFLFIEVEDNGAGIPPDVLEQLPDRYEPKGTTSSGFALRNIHERLALFYGDGNFEFTVSSELYCGTYVAMRLPLNVHEQTERRLQCTH